MKRTKRQDDDDSSLPAPIVLTPDQLKAVTAETAGGSSDCGYINPCPLPPTIHGGVKAAQ